MNGHLRKRREPMNDLSMKDLSEIADMMISYHMHSFRIRREKIFDIEVKPRLVDELENFRWWTGNVLNGEEKYTVGLSVRQAMSDTEERISDLTKEAKSAEETEDLTGIYEQAQEYMEQMRSYNYLMELL